MAEIKKVLLCGLGAVGLTVACRIQKHLPNCLKVLVDEKRLQKLQANPMRMNAEEKVFDYILPDEKDFVADLVIISTKFDGLNSVLENIENFVGENTLILPIINGLKSEEKIAQKYGWEKVLHGYFICHSAERTENCVTQDGVFKIVFGSDNQEKNQVVAQFFESVGVDFDNPEDILYAKWVKFGLNIVVNHCSCILKMKFGEMQRSEKFLAFAKNILEEIVELAKCEGVKNYPNLTEDVISALFLMSEDGKTSMWQDIEAGKKTELDIFAGTVLELGKKHNVLTPYNQVFYEMIRLLEGR